MLPIWRVGRVWLNALVLKTSNPKGFGGSNPSLVVKKENDFVMNNSGFEVGDKVKLKPIDEIMQIREKYTKQGYFRGDLNYKFEADIRKLYEDNVYTIEDIRLREGMVNVYEIFLKESGIGGRWVLTNEYFIQSNIEEPVDNDIPLLFGMMEGNNGKDV